MPNLLRYVVETSFVVNVLDLCKVLLEFSCGKFVIFVENWKVLMIRSEIRTLKGDC